LFDVDKAAVNVSLPASAAMTAPEVLELTNVMSDPVLPKIVTVDVALPNRVVGPAPPTNSSLLAALP